MEKVPIAIEILKNSETYDEDYPTVSIDDAINAMIEFAKLHVKAALETTNENVFLIHKSGYGREYEPDNESTRITKVKSYSISERGFGESYYNTILIDEESILKAYPETLIK